MAKKLPLTQKIRDLIASATDGAVDPELVSVYETISINSLPVNKRNIFENAEHSLNTLQDMANVANARPMAMHIPMHMNHDQGYGMPVGKVFHGEVNSNSGYHELRSLFYIDNSETSIISKLETDSISEVSVGVRYKALNCSQCGWDFLGADATDEHIWSRTCGNDHQIGVEGVHLKLNGLDRWLEQSLVSLGAATGAKIIPRTKALLGDARYNELAATGVNPAGTTLYASATPKDNMDLTKLIQELTDAKVLVAQKDAEIVALKLTAEKLTAAEAQVVTLSAEVAALKGTDILKLTEDRNAAVKFARTEADRLCLAAGVTPMAETASLTELTASISENRTKLADKFPTGGRSEPQGSSAGAQAAPASSFKTVR